VVERVVRFHAELQAEWLANGKVLEYRKVPVVSARSAQQCPAGVAQGTGLWEAENISPEIPRERSLILRQHGITDHVDAWALGRSARDVGVIGGSEAHSRGGSSNKCIDAGDLPAVQDPFGYGRVVPHTRGLVEEVHSQIVCTVVRRQTVVRTRALENSEAPANCGSAVTKISHAKPIRELNCTPVEFTSPRGTPG